MQNITSYYSKALKRGRPLKSGSDTLKINSFFLYHPPPPKKKTLDLAVVRKFVFVMSLPKYTCIS